ncbi:MAG: glycoside hydrolase family 37 [Sinorhizobium meliloti]|jgi:glycogen debranching enzyme|uniref:amylo-alpha-1,6-glucosidase n=1 Tax=Rhizobium meliloti TaxID=382 RepID=UPI00036603BB|nr:trehalase family glycosidase [Sinorhizobium meliloti]MCG5487015.1 glycoside hydrolase family 37 [Sinorhizobium meliloti]RVQ02422.1 glycoside hydrolase family 37 [Sinorhizobium meliloti]
MLFDIDHVPFSRKGRFLTLSTMRVPGRDGERALYLRCVSGGDERPSLGRLCRVELLDGNGRPAAARFELSPDQLVARTGEGIVRFVIGDGERLHIRGENAGVRFHVEGSRYDYVYRTPGGEYCLVAASENVKLIPRACLGDLAVSGKWDRDRSTDVSFTLSGEGTFEGDVDFFRALPPPKSPGSFEVAHAAVAAEFSAWYRSIPAGVPGQEEAQRLAAYLLWANTVPAEGVLTRPAIYMSKNAMINIWSWDNAFSALGVAGFDEELAFDQFAAIFDHQDASGLLPDYVNDREALFAFTKPPVHGWAVSCLARENPAFLTPERRAYLRDAIGRQVSYWLTHGRAGGGVLPSYFHGNDSGWDNASFFAEGGPVLSPDLPVFLILACEALANLLEDDTEKAARWLRTADELQALLVGTLWTGETFAARLAADPKRILPGDSLIQFMPLLLGSRLPGTMCRQLVARLVEGAFITDWGPATESPRSSYYEDDGYWRGPIWAPTTYLLWDGLRRQGERALAREIAQRFCALANAHGMAENFDARSGRGLRDRAFAWTSAVYLLLAQSLRDKTGEELKPSCSDRP